MTDQGAGVRTLKSEPLSDVSVHYLDLLKRSLTGALAEDSDIVLGGARTRGDRQWGVRLGHLAGEVLSRFGLELVYKVPFDPLQRENGRDWPMRAESMIGLRRMDNIQTCVQAVIADNVPGDLIETGAWRGGACIFMKANLLVAGDTNRTVWVADSFQGLPKPNSRLFPTDAMDTLYQRPYLSVGVDEVKRNFERYGLLDDRVQFLVGWFKDTLPAAPIDRLSVLRLDGDMYESTLQAIDSLYPKLSVGGFCIVDDFGSHPRQAGQAVLDYRATHGVEDPIIDIDGFGVYWRKGRA